jgi:Ca2+:H+ antiporter
VARKILWASLALAPITFLSDFVLHAGDVVLFLLSAVSLVPLAWLIGEATEQASEHTGPRIGGFLNASFGNAPEVIIALFAVGSGLPNVVRGSLAGSVVSNLLLVLGFALIAQSEGRVDRMSLLVQLALVGLAVLAFLVPSIPGWDGDPDRHSLAVVTTPIAAVLLAIYVAVTVYNLRGREGPAAAGEGPRDETWSLRRSLAWLGAATAATALISEILVHSIHAFADAAGLSEFFIAVVIVALVGNAAEHGGAVVIAARGKVSLASEIAISSSAQVALFVTPVVALVSWLVKPALPLAFRPVELAAMAASTLLAAGIVWDGRSRRWHGVVLITAYIGAVLVFLAAGNR